jgi:hypothetical protein
MLNLSSSSGSGNYIRFSPQANAWTNNNNEEITLKKVVFDIDNICTGWLLLGVGVRDWVQDESVGKKGPQPSPEHKRGFIVTLYNKEIGAAEWSSNGVGPNMGLEQMYKACAAERAANPGKLPVVEYKGSKAEKIGKGTTRIPQFALSSWVAAPAGLTVVKEAEFDHEYEPAYQEPAPVAQPVRKAAPKPVEVVEDDEIF